MQKTPMANVTLTVIAQASAKTDYAALSDAFVAEAADRPRPRMYRSKNKANSCVIGHEGPEGI